MKRVEMGRHPNYILLGEANGHVQLLNAAINQITQSTLLDYTACAHKRRPSVLASVFDIVRVKGSEGGKSVRRKHNDQDEKTSRFHLHHLVEYAFATKRGVLFCRLDTEAPPTD